MGHFGGGGYIEAQGSGIEPWELHSRSAQDMAVCGGKRESLSDAQGVMFLVAIEACGAG
jgi:hypothetical protein